MKRAVPSFIIIPLMLMIFVHVVYAQRAKESSMIQETILIEKGGVLLPQGAWVIEPGFQYSNTSRTRISISGFTLLETIVIGKIITEDIERNIISPFVNFRVGLTDYLQIELNIPWLYRMDNELFVVGPAGEDFADRTVRESHIGDIEIGLNYQLLRERGIIPDIVMNMRGKTRTGKDPYGLETEIVPGLNSERPSELPSGSGHYGLSVGFTFVKASDPAAFYGNIGYFFNFEREIGGSVGTVNPGDSLEFSGGMAYALNEKLSTSISFQQRFTFKTEQNGVKIIASDVNVGSILFGISYALTDRTALSISVAAGLSKDAPDLTLGVRVPFSF